MVCNGNSSEFCGAGNRLDLYKQTGASTTGTGSATPSTTPGGPVHVQTAGGKTWQGCYTEATGGRALTGASTTNYQTMTVEACANFCAAFIMFGVEYSKKKALGYTDKKVTDWLK